MLWSQTIENGHENDHVFGNVMDFLRNLQTLGQKRTDLTCDSNQDVYVSSRNIILDIVDEETIAKGRTFQDIPINSQLQILSYLDVASLCRATQVCSLWKQLTEDSILWDAKLHHDADNWQVIDHLTHPENYRRTCPDLMPKEIYIKCCPEYRSQAQTNSSLQLSRLRNYLGLSVPRIVMFGSGLDSSGLVNRILMDRRSPFTVNGMFPGQYDGIGSGVTLRHQDGTINLITLYALSKAERENTDNVDKQSRLLVEKGDSSNSEMTLSQPIKQLCATINSFIYIVDASSVEKVTHRNDEFKAMIDDRWLQPNARILVLCIVPNATVPSVSSLKVADKLDMVNLSRPWQVRQCHVNSLYGFMPGLKWVTAHV